ncbi:MAG: major facilitator superfamily protein [Planctomycetota bacterium]|nr:MAG: major facilitator superfamily protein [Planctomycetota bacterium]
MSAPPTSWRDGVTRYQWLVLTIASLGWVFDVFEGQIYVSSMNELLSSLLPGKSAGEIAFAKREALSAFLVGGAVGGVLFGVLADRIGRTKTMVLTILLYSVFTFATAFAQTWWQVVVLRFFVALGVGGEWAVASAFVSEVFPKHARAWSGAVFHGSSVLGTYLAVAAGAFIVSDPRFGWRWAFGLGALPALLTLWIRWRLKEPDAWTASREQPRVTRSPFAEIGELFGRELRGRTLLAASLAFVGLATFWGVHIYGKDFLLHRARERVLHEAGVAASAENAAKQLVFKEHKVELKRAEMWGMFLVTTGGGLGLLAFGPICERLGRRRAFLLFHLGGMIAALALFQGLASSSDQVLTWVLPVFGFLTLGMHAGYAIYFPELYPTRLRSSGAGFCFNFARSATAAMLLVDGAIQKAGLSFENAASLLSLLFLVGIVLLAWAPETKGTELPE